MQGGCRFRSKTLCGARRSDVNTDSTNEGKQGDSEGGRVEHCLVRVDINGFVIFLDNGGGMRYETLEELISRCSKFRTLWPDVPKATAFPMPL